MRLSPQFCALGVILVGLLNSASAQGLMALSPTDYYRPASSSTYPPAPVSAGPYAPGSCPTPVYPPTTVSPGVAPGAPTTTPPGAAPGAAAPGAAAPGAAAPGAAAPGAAPEATAPTTSAFTGAEAVGGGAPAAGASAAGSAAPTMIGDLQGGGTMRITVRLPNGSTTTARVPLATRGAFKISENESPRPMDRVFINYNYFNNLSTFGGPSFDLHRETFGFEKTFLDGNASFGVRLPVLLKSGTSDGVGVDGFGDTSFIGKYAFINNLQTGNVLSGGLVVTAPTGRDVLVSPGSNLHSTLLQPYMGFIYNQNRLYALGFSSIVAPTDGRDVTFMSNDLGLGYRAYQACDNQAITALTPTIEAHLTTPLNHRSADSVIFVPDQLTLTGGVHIGLWNRTYLTLGMAVPVTGPRPYDFEVLGQLNVRF
jgi:hypothetical protein